MKSRYHMEGFQYVLTTTNVAYLGTTGSVLLQKDQKTRKFGDILAETDVCETSFFGEISMILLDCTYSVCVCVQEWFESCPHERKKN